MSMAYKRLGPRPASRLSSMTPRLRDFLRAERALRKASNPYKLNWGGAPALAKQAEWRSELARAYGVLDAMERAMVDGREANRRNKGQLKRIEMPDYVGEGDAANGS